MGIFSTSAPDPLGLTEGATEKRRCYMRGGAGTKGQVVRFDLAAADTGTTASTIFGLSTSPTANVLVATGSHTSADDPVVYLCGILLDDVADDALVDVCIRSGRVQALGGDTSAAGVGLVPGTSSRLVAAATKQRVIAIALQTMVSAALCYVMFDGMNGFGFAVDVTP